MDLAFSFLFIYLVHIYVGRGGKPRHYTKCKTKH